MNVDEQQACPLPGLHRLEDSPAPGSPNRCQSEAFGEFEGLRWPRDRGFRWQPQQGLVGQHHAEAQVPDRLEGTVMGLSPATSAGKASIFSALTVCPAAMD